MTLWEIMVGYPGSQDIDQHPYYPYRLAKLAWHVYHHSFTKNGRWFLAGTAIANLSFTMFWSFDIQTWILATAINCIWIPDFIAKLLPLSDTVSLSGKSTIQIGDELICTVDAKSLSPNSLLHFESLPLALMSSHDEGFASPEQSVVQLSLTGRFRGTWDVPALRISRPGPFGLIARSRVIPSSLQVCVLPHHPDYASLERARTICSEMSTLRNSGDHSASLGTDTTRTYIPGDPTNKIHWRASSRTAATSNPALLVRISPQNTNQGVHIVVDERVQTNPLSNWQHWSGRGVREPLPIPEFEELISLAYACALSVSRDGHIIASISSQRQRFTHIRTVTDIAEAFASIRHSETATDRINHSLPPTIPDEDAYVFTLVPQQLPTRPSSSQNQPVCVIADLTGIVHGNTVVASA